MMELVKIFVLSISSIVVLFILTKIMGYRQMSQLSMFDYINGITIGSIAAEMSTAIDDNFLEPLLAMVIYALVAVLLSKLSMHSIYLRRFINGKSFILYKDEVLYYKNFKKAKIDFQEFLITCRCSGYFDLSDLKLVVLEPNGKMSFIPKENSTSEASQDSESTAQKESYAITIIIDGKILDKNLRQTGNNVEWLKNQLLKNKISNIKDVIVGTCSIENEFKYYLSTENIDDNDFFI